MNTEQKDIKELAYSYKKSGKLELAEKYFLSAKYHTPFDKTIYYELGLIEAEKKNYIKAIKLYMRAIKLDPSYIEAITAMAEAHENIEEYDMAEMIYIRITEKVPNHLDTYNRLGNLYLKTCDYKKAMVYFREILYLNENYIPAYLGMAECFDKKEKVIEARRYYKKYMEKETDINKKQYALHRLEALKFSKKTTCTRQNFLKIVG